MKKIKKIWVENHLDAIEGVKIVDDISKSIDESTSGIHLPIGSRLDDSIPIEFLSDSDLAYFSEKIIPKITQLTIENQQRFPRLLYSFPPSLKKQKERNKKNLQRLRQAGIL